LLPFFKDPKIKFSVWKILRDAIGKDLSKIQVPVYFNQPTNPLQQIASSFEYYDLLEKSYDIEDPFLRLAKFSCMSASGLSQVERASAKPFNPLLGETFEMVNDKYSFLAE
jgi:hypothetical protein